MQMRQLGNQGLTVSELGLGCMGLSDFYSSSGVTEAQSISLVHRALELGLTFLDTADAYGPHTNELTVGKAIKGRRDSVVEPAGAAWLYDNLPVADKKLISLANSGGGPDNIACVVADLVESAELAASPPRA